MNTGKTRNGIPQLSADFYNAFDPPAELGTANTPDPQQVNQDLPARTADPPASTDPPAKRRRRKRYRTRYADFLGVFYTEHYRWVEEDTDEKTEVER